MLTELVTPCVPTNSYSTLLKVRQRGEKNRSDWKTKKKTKQLLGGLKKKKGY